VFLGRFGQNRRRLAFVCGGPERGGPGRSARQHGRSAGTRLLRAALGAWQHPGRRISRRLAWRACAVAYKPRRAVRLVAPQASRLSSAGRVEPRRALSPTTAALTGDCLGDIRRRGQGRPRRRRGACFRTGPSAAAEVADPASATALRPRGRAARGCSAAETVDTGSEAVVGVAAASLLAGLRCLASISRSDPAGWAAETDAGAQERNGGFHIGLLAG
jgi:hypothetical protein